MANFLQIPSRLLRRFLPLASVFLLSCGEEPLSPLAPEGEIPFAGVSLDQVARRSTKVGPGAFTPSSLRKKLIKASEGGVVTLDIYTVVIPPGALTEDTVISIELPRQPPADEYFLWGLGPSGTQFTVPVEVRIDLSNESVNGNTLTAARWEGDQWVRVGGRFHPPTGIFSVSLGYFSTYGLLRKGDEPGGG